LAQDEQGEGLSGFMASLNSYGDELRKTKSLIIIAALQLHRDTKAIRAIEAFSKNVAWRPLSNLMISQMAWEHVKQRRLEAKFVFCHPQILQASPLTSLYYRGLSALSIKAVKSYCGGVESLESGEGKLSAEKALRMARVYNTFTCSVIENSHEWTLENGRRSIVATLGISLDGTVRNKIGTIAEKRIRGLIVEWLVEHKLIVSPRLPDEKILDYEKIPRLLQLKKGITMEFRSEPDVSFRKDKELLAVIEIKGGIDPAGALERYGAGTKSFQNAVKESSHCKNFYLGAVFTPELDRRIKADRLVEKTFNIIDIVADAGKRDEFFNEVFNHTLRLA
jgi:hypothetical protein